MSHQIRLEERVPSAEDYNRLRRDAGWPEMGLEAAQRFLPASLCAFCALDDGELVGMGRVVGDGGLSFYVQDLIVLKSHQGRGIGAALMTLLVDWIGERAVENTTVGLMSAAGKEPFYHKWGFTSRPAGDLGCGMTRFWEV